MQRPVLLVIDMLNDYFGNWEAASRGRLAGSINDLVRTMRAASRPVVWVRQEFEPDLRDAFAEMRAKNIHITIKGTAGAQMLPELEVEPTDQVVIKKRYSAFFGTDLEGLLRALAPDALILAGINTHACIRTTAIDAYQRDWPVVLASDCVASYDQEHHEVSLRYMRGKIAEVMSNQEIRSALGTAPGSPR